MLLALLEIFLSPFRLSFLMFLRLILELHTNFFPENYVYVSLIIQNVHKNFGLITCLGQFLRISI